MQGFLGGVGAGLVVAVVGLGTASLMAPQPAGNRPPEAPQVEPPAEAQGTTAPDAAAPVAVVEGEAAPDVAPVEGPKVPAEGGVLPEADRTTAEAPDVTAGDTVLGEPPAEPALATLGAGAGAEAEVVAEVPRAAAPVVPALETAVEAVTVPAEPLAAEEPAPVPEVAPELDVPEAGEMAAAAVPDAEPAIVAEAEEERLPEAGLVEPSQPVGAGELTEAPASTAEAGVEPVEQVPEMQPPATEAAAVPDSAPAVPAFEAPVVVDSPGEPVEPGLPGVVPQGLDLPQVGTEPEAASEVAVAPEVVPEALPGVNGEAGLPGGDGGVRVNRPTDEGAGAAAVGIEPALVAYAADWENSGDLPMMGIVLVDDGALPGAAAAVAALPVPVTVAVDPGAPGAAELAAAWRAAGVEVMVIAGLPEGAAPVDVAVTFEAVFALIPEAVGVIDTGAGGLQVDRAVTEQAMARLAADGRGAVVPGGGLNMAARAAAEAGVPLATIYRDIDGDAAGIRRQLDQAAFRARQDSGVVLVGQVRAETLSALMLWGAEQAAEQVAVAPVSAILLADAPG
jgi:hypothetical protein